MNRHRAEALAEAMDWIATRSSRTFHLPPNETLDAWFERWLRVYARGHSAESYRSMYELWIAPLLGQLLVAEITPGQLEDWVAFIDRAVVREKLGWVHADHIWSLICRLFRDAHRGKSPELRARTDDPTRFVLPPERGPHREGTFLYPRELLALVSCEQVPLIARRAYALLTYLGPRASEMLAFRLTNIDWSTWIVSIWESIDSVTGLLKPTKSASTRQWFAEPNIRPLLTAIANDDDTGGMICPWLPDAKSLRRHLWWAGCRRRELYANTATRKRITIHCLRGTYITWRLMRGDSLLDVQEEAGHVFLETTLRYLRRRRFIARILGGDVFPALPCVLCSGVVPYGLVRTNARGRGPYHRWPSLLDGPTPPSRLVLVDTLEALAKRAFTARDAGLLRASPATPELAGHVVESVRRVATPEEWANVQHAVERVGGERVVRLLTMVGTAA